MNELLMQVLRPESKLVGHGLRILSAMRGPDYENKDWQEAAVLKDKFVSPIRLWVLGRELYSCGGYSPHNVEDVAPLDSEGQLMKLVTDLKVYWMESLKSHKSYNHHWLDHVRLAYAGVAALQGWRSAAVATSYGEFYNVHPSQY